MSNCYVVVTEIETGRVIKRLGPMDSRKAARVELGIFMQMDRSRLTVGIDEGGSTELMGRP